MKNLGIKLLVLLLIFLMNTGCKKTESGDIKLFIYEVKKEEALSPDLFSKKVPDLILNRSSFQKVKLIQWGDNDFTLEIKLSKQEMDRIGLLMSKNEGKRLVFIRENRILISPVILGSLTKEKIVIELPEMEKKEAVSIIQCFRKEYEFFDARPSKEIEKEVEKIYELRDKGEIEKAIEMFSKLIKKAKNPNEKIVFYNEIALCYILKGDYNRAGEIYKKIVNEIVNLDLDNYKIISQAYFYLYRLERFRKNKNLSEYYFKKGIETLEYIINSFPFTISAQEANLRIGGYFLLNGNIEEAEKRARIAKKGDFRCQAYFLMGLCYEYQRKFKEASDEYKVILGSPSCKTEEKEIAKEFIKNLKVKKTNIEEFMNAILLSM
jgi:tetratricopeptide (TPR) repeat protein